MKNILLCPITGSELIYVGCDDHIMDGNSYYSPIDDKSIIYAVYPRSPQIYTLVEYASYNAKGKRYFKLIDDDSWQELKRVPHGDKLFPIDDYGSEWETACSDALTRHEQYLEQCKHWDETPSEDPRVKAKIVSFDEVEVRPLPKPTGILFYLDYTYNNDKP